MRCRHLAEEPAVCTALSRLLHRLTYLLAEPKIPANVTTLSALATKESRDEWTPSAGRPHATHSSQRQ